MPDDPNGADRGSIRQIAWRELFPWLGLGRTFRLATDPRQLLLAAAGVLLTTAGWWLLAFAFSGTAEPVTKHVIRSYEVWPWQPPAPPPWVAPPPSPGMMAPLPGAVGVTESIPPTVVPIPREGAGEIASAPSPATVSLIPAPPPPRPLLPGPGLEPTWPRINPIVGSWLVLSRPFLQLFDRGFTVTGFAFVLLCALWGVAVWGLFGGAITRLAAVRLARDERVSLGHAIRHARARWGSYFWAPLFPQIGVLLPTLGLAAVGWLARFDAGIIALGVLFPLLLVGGVLIVILLLGLLFGWPLMWATISTEGTDTFDALSRTYAYVYQRPLSYLFYLVVATILGWLAAAFAWGIGAAVVYLTLWGTSWSAGVGRTEQIVAEIAPRVSIVWPVPAPPPPPPVPGNSPRFAAGALADSEGTPVPPPLATLSPTGRTGARLIAIWIGLVELVVIAFNVNFFWSAATAIYFLLRQQVDATELDEVFVEEEEERFGLPPLEVDAAGVPRAADVEADAPPDADAAPQ